MAKRKLTDQDEADLARIRRVLCIPQDAAAQVHEPERVCLAELLTQRSMGGEARATSLGNSLPRCSAASTTRARCRASAVVGTITRWNSNGRGGTYAGTMAFHSIHRRAAPSK